MKTIKFTFVFISVLSFLKIDFASADAFLTPGETGSLFLATPISARTIAMGAGVVGLTEEIYGFENNPAVLATMKDHQLTFSRSQLYQDTNFTSFAFAMETKNNFGFGLQYRRFGVTDDARDSSGFELGERIQLHDNGFQLGTGYSFLEGRLAVGYSLEYIRRFIYRYTAITYAHHLGISSNLTEYLSEYMPGQHTFGLSVQNIGDSVSFIREEESLPLIIRLGGAHRFGERDMELFEEVGNYTQPIWTGVWEINQFRDQEAPNGSIGGEWRPYSLLALRLGLEHRQQVHLTGGVGFQWRNIQLDYGIQGRSEVGLAHTVSLAMRWSSFGIAEDFDD